MLSSLLLPEQACFFKLSKLSWLNKLETVKTHASLLYIRIKMHALNLLSVWMPSPSTLWLKLKYFPLDIRILYLIKMRKPRNSVSLVKRQNLYFSNINSTLLTQSFHCQQTVWINFTSDMILPRHFDLHVYEIPKTLSSF